MLGTQVKWKCHQKTEHDANNQKAGQKQSMKGFHLEHRFGPSH
jgi:hypothetical protein